MHVRVCVSVYIGLCVRVYYSFIIQQFNRKFKELEKKFKISTRYQTVLYYRRRKSPSNRLPVFFPRPLADAPVGVHLGS